MIPLLWWCLVEAAGVHVPNLTKFPWRTWLEVAYQHKVRMVDWPDPKTKAFGFCYIPVPGPACDPAKLLVLHLERLLLIGKSEGHEKGENIPTIVKWTAGTHPYAPLFTIIILNYSFPS